MGLAYEASWEDALKDFLDHIKSCRAPKTHSFYRTQLGQLFDWADERGIALGDFSSRDMRLYITFRLETVALSTLHHDKLCARAFFKFARQEGYIRGRPLQNLDMRKPVMPERYCPTEEDISKLLEAITTKWRIKTNPGVASMTPNQRAFFSRRDRAIVSGLVATGCRIGELLNLTLLDLDLPKAEMRIGPMNKSRRPRTVLFGPWAIDLCAWLEVRPDVECENVFISDSGHPITRNWMSKKVTSYAELAGLKNISAHSVRHYSATSLAMVSPVAAQRILGHRDLSTTMGYVHAVSEDIRAAYQQADPLGRVLGRKKAVTKRRRII